MNAIRYLLLFGADALVIGCVVFLFVLCLWYPLDFALFDTSKKRNGRIPIGTYAFVLTSGIGIGIFIYHGITYLFSWMPHSWGATMTRVNLKLTLKV
jgi:hypothetical protein